MRRTESDQICNAVDQNGRFSAASARQNQQRTVGGKHSLPLHLVQAAKLFFNVGITQGTKFLLESCCHCFTCSLSYFRVNH